MSLVGRKAKEEVVRSLAERIGRGRVIVVGYQGLTGGELTEIRARLRPQAARMNVVRHTLAERAFAAAGGVDMSDLFTTPSALVLEGHDPVETAKLLAAFAKEHPKLEIRGGLLEGKRLSVREVQALAQLPPRHVLLTSVARSMQAPLAGLAGVLGGLLRALVTGVDALRRQREAVTA